MNKCASNDNVCTYTLYTQDNSEVRQPKRKFKTSDEAIRAAMFMNIKESTVHKYVAYKCNKCGFFHIGHTSKLLTEKDRRKANAFISNLRKEKHYGKINGR